MKFLLSISIFFLISEIYAAEVIGVKRTREKTPSDSVEPYSQSDVEYDEERPVPPRRKSKLRTSSQQSQREDTDDARKWGFSMSLGLGFRSFSTSATISHYLNRYLGLNFSGFYLTRSWDEKKETEYGPEVDLLFRLPNPSLITPFVGAGPGWIKWQREQNNVNFETSASFTANYFVGANLRLTSFLVFQVVQKWITYLNNPPLQFDNQDKYEPRNRSVLSIGLALII